jgi:hypothetical protein
MGVVRFALRFPHTFSVLAALILFLGITAMRAYAAMGASDDSWRRLQPPRSGKTCQTGYDRCMKNCRRK